MTDYTAFPPLPSAGACALPHLGVIRAVGPDAASFLHNQLTQDFLLIQPGQARLAAFCNAKGRMQASMVGFKTGQEEVLLVMRQDLLPQTLKRLSMFVLRAKVKLSDASADWPVWGVLQADGGAPWSCQPWHPAAANTEASSAWQLSLYPAVGVFRSLVVGPMSADLPLLNLADWQLGEVLSGIADVQAATFEAFVPQMLNYESVDGVNFKKGCYPGQEVVARSQFRGTLKRRTYLVSSDKALLVGQEVFTGSVAAGSDQSQTSAEPVGIVAHTASHPAHGDWALVCLQNSALEAAFATPTGSTSGAVTLRTSTGASLTLHPLPYELRDDI